MRWTFALTLAVMAVLAGCGSGAPAAAPTDTPGVATVESTDTPTASATATATATAPATRTATPTPTATATATPSPTPTATATPTPTATPRPDIDFSGEKEVVGTQGDYKQWEFGGTVTNADTRTVTLTLYPKLYTADDCDITYELDDPAYTVTLQPGESWSPPERWEFTLHADQDVVHYTLLAERGGC